MMILSRGEYIYIYIYMHCPIKVKVKCVDEKKEHAGCLHGTSTSYNVW